MILVGLAGHPINRHVPYHLDRSLVQPLRMEVRRPEFVVQLDLPFPDPSINHVVLGSIDPRDAGIAVRRVAGETRQPVQDAAPIRASAAWSLLPVIFDSVWRILSIELAIVYGLCGGVAGSGIETRGRQGSWFKGIVRL